MQGPSGEQYVTIIQDGQTYAIPASDYAAMMAQQGLEVVEPQDNEARVGGDQPEHTVLPAVTTQASSHLTESLTLPTTPMPPTIPHLTPCSHLGPGVQPGGQLTHYQDRATDSQGGTDRCRQDAKTRDERAKQCKRGD